MCMTGKPEVQHLLGTSLKTSRGTLRTGVKGELQRKQEKTWARSISNEA